MRPLTDSDLGEAQAVYERAPAFFRILGLDAAPGNCARENFEALPPGFPPARKHHFGIYLLPGQRLVGIADYLDGYPEPGIGWVGLLLLDESHQGRGLGREAWLTLLGWAEPELGAREMRLGVEAPNSKAVRFWTAAGFVPNGETSRGDYGHEVIVMARRGAPATPA